MTSHTKCIKNNQNLQLEITWLKNHITYAKSAINIKCMLHFSQFLFGTFAVPINI
jgi:hypothetical protein